MEVCNFGQRRSVYPGPERKLNPHVEKEDQQLEHLRGEEKAEGGFEGLERTLVFEDVGLFPVFGLVDPRRRQEEQKGHRAGDAEAAQDAY